MTINNISFSELMNRLATAWGTQNTDLALSCFCDDAIYMQPPDIQVYIGHDQLRAYFGALTAGTYLRYHHIWFDETKQVGCVEFTFGIEGKPKADTGIIVITLRDGLIAHWREYFQKGSANFAEFIGVDGKEWQWHIGNYP